MGEDLPPPADIWGMEDCLASKKFVLTGYNPGVSRVQVEELIKFFGGAVRTSVNGQTSFLLCVGQKLEDWATGKDTRKVESSQKFQKAGALQIPILHGLEDLFKLVRAASEQDGASLESSRAKLVCFKFAQVPP